MELIKIDYDNNKDIDVQFSIDQGFRFLACKVVGKIQNGSKGNNAADYLFGKICQYYFQTNCCVLILDFSELEYEFVDRFRKSINFFNLIGRDEEEKEFPVLIIKPQKPEGINKLIQWLQSANITQVNDIEEAVLLSEKLFNDFIE